jgi:ribosomal protein L25 (general stress protein Ctc)
LGGLFVYLLVWSGVRLTIETVSGRELYGLSALSRARNEGAIGADVYERERSRTTRAFGASVLAAILASAGYGMILRLSSKPKSA